MLSLLDIRARIDAGTLTPEAALRASRAAIDACDAEIRAVVHLDREARAAGSAGPLSGIALGVKDIIDVAGLPTRMGSPIYEANVPIADASVVAAARRLGAVPLAKTATTPFAFLDPVETRNPAAPDRTPGGSSSGSAAAVAAGMLPLALGTQTGGSVIRPAAFCGVAAVKPSFKLLPTVGCKTFSWTLDTLGLFAARVADVAFALAALSERPQLALRPGDPRETYAGLRIGVLAQSFAGDPEEEGAHALETAARAAERAGARVVRVAEPAALADAFALHGVIQGFEARQALAFEHATHAERLPPLLAASLAQAQAVGAAEYDAARRVVHGARAGIRALFSDCDALLTHAAPGPAPLGLGSTGDSRFNRLWTLTGDPCVSVPGLRARDGAPIGVQLISRFGRDEEALAAAAFVECALAGSA